MRNRIALLCVKIARRLATDELICDTLKDAEYWLRMRTRQ